MCFFCVDYVGMDLYMQSFYCVNFDVMDVKFLMLGVKGVFLCYLVLKMYVFYQVILEGVNRVLYSLYLFKINFKEGGMGIFIFFFMNLIKSVRVV